VRVQHVQKGCYRFSIEKIEEVPEQADIEQGVRWELQQVLKLMLQVRSCILVGNDGQLGKDIDEMQFAAETAKKIDGFR
jgi:hypothetical protein